MKHFFLLFIFFYSSLRAQISWQQVSTLPDSPRYTFADFVIGNSYYLIGGADSEATVLSDIWAYNIDSAIWSKKHNGPFQKIADVSGAASQYGYIIDGCDSNTLFEKTCWKYQASADTWSPIAPTPQDNQWGVTFLYSRYLYTCFGYDSLYIAGTSIWRYDTVTNIWQSMTPLPASGRTESSVIVVDSFAYLIGGRDTNAISLNEIWRYNMIQDKWENMPAIPADSGRENPAVFGFENFLLVCFGVYQNGPANIFFDVNNSIYKLDFASNQWSQVSYTGSIRPSCCGGFFQYAGKCYIYGGVVADSPTAYILDNKLWSFDPSSLGPVYAGEEGVPGGGAYVFKAYPNPLINEQSFTVVCSEEGIITFYNALGQVVSMAALASGTNSFDCAQINCGSDFLFYKAQMSDGRIETGKLSIIK